MLPARPRSGLVLGKFLPPHAGHQFLLDFAASSVDHLTVLVCSLAREPIPGALRHAWVRELCPRATVLHVTDENPSEPQEHPDFWSIWIGTIRRRVPEGPSVLFTSEPYGDELASRLGARHVPVDPGRAQVPVSGTAVRQHPLDHWQHLPPCVRPWFVRRVVVHGAESTGKTTLARALAQQYDTTWVAEYARSWLDHTGRAFCHDDLEWIVRGQIASEDALARQANRVIFCDTDLLTTLVYSDWMLVDTPGWLVEAAASRRCDLHLVPDVDVPWAPDRQRHFAARRQELHQAFLAQLTARRLPHLVLRGSWDERFAAACSAVDALLTDATASPAD